MGAALLCWAPQALTQDARPLARTAPAPASAAAPSLPAGLASSDWVAIRAAHDAGRQAAYAAAGAGQTYLKASNTGGNDGFGSSMALSGDTLVIGAPSESSSATGVDGDQGNDDAFASGAVYVFVRDGATWIQQAYLKASNAEADDIFGTTIALEGDTLVVGASGEDSGATGVGGNEADNSTANSGAAYVFVRDGSTWTQQAYLKASNPDAADRFAQGGLSLSGDTLVVGALFEDSAATGVGGNQANDLAANSGAAYVFVRDGSTWSQQAYLKASNTGAQDKFGAKLSLSGDTLVVGASSESSAATGVDGDGTNDDAFKAGAAYVFVRDGSTWTQQAYLKASNTAASDFFGSSVCASGDTVVVSANREGSDATGVDGDQGNDDAPGSGAVYVFARDGTTWSQQAYLKASNTDPDDLFGSSVSLSGDTLVVGAAGEDSGATGLDGDQADNGVDDSGAVYVFARSGASWSQQTYVKASNAGAFDYFGSCVARSGETLAAGAPGEGSDATGVDGDPSVNWLVNAGAAYVQPLGPAPWCDLGGAVAGTNGLPLLTGSGTLAGGTLATLSLVDGLPGGSTNLVLGVALLAAPFKGGTLVPTPDLILAGLPLDGSGALDVAFPWPVGLPVGAAVYWQHWIPDAGAPVGFAASNGLSSTQP